RSAHPGAPISPLSLAPVAGRPAGRWAILEAPNQDAEGREDAPEDRTCAGRPVAPRARVRDSARRGWIATGPSRASCCPVVAARHLRECKSPANGAFAGPSRMGREGFEPSTLGLRAACDDLG